MNLKPNALTIEAKNVIEYDRRHYWPSHLHYSNYFINQIRTQTL